MGKKLLFVMSGGLLISLLFPALLLADGIMKLDQTGQLLPLLKSEVDIEIFEQVAITTVEHTFYKASDEDSVPVKYMFPLPEDASVVQFGIFLEDSTFLEFEMSVSDTGGGGHGDVSEEDPDLADYLLPNPFIIPLKVSDHLLRVRLKYVELLPYHFGKMKLEYPLYSDRFLEGIIEIVNIHIELSSHRAITDMSSSSHSIVTNKISDYSATVDYSEGSTVPDRNFQFEFTLAQEEIGLFNFCYRDPLDTLETDGYFILLIEPSQQVTQEEIVQKYFNFIMDRSGSMSGTKIVQARQAATYCVEHLNEKDSFNIIDFSTNYNSFSNDAVPATTENIQSAVDYISRINAGGGTNLYNPTMFALTQSFGEGTANQIVLLTDGRHNSGSVTNLDQVVQNITDANTQDARIFAFGIGHDVDKGFLQKLANNNHGLAMFVESQYNFDDVIAEFFSRISTPVLVNISLNYGSIGANDVYPAELQDVFVGSQLVVTGRYKNFGVTDIELSGTLVGTDTTFVYSDVDFPETATDYPFVTKIWAKSKIEHLYQQWLILGEPEQIKQQIIALSLKYGVLSPFTQYTPPEPPPTAVEEVEMVTLAANWHIQQTGPGIELTWSLQNISPDQLTYNVYRSTSESGDFFKINSSPLTELYFIDQDVDLNQTYYYKIEAIHPTGEVYASQIIEVTPLTANNFLLLQNYPNPFNSSTTIRYTLPKNSYVEIQIFDILGRSIQTLVRAQQDAGLKSVTWDGKDELGKAVSTGIYFYQLKTDHFNQMNKMLYLR